MLRTLFLQLFLEVADLLAQLGFSDYYGEIDRKNKTHRIYHRVKSTWPPRLGASAPRCPSPGESRPSLGSPGEGVPPNRRTERVLLTND
jgi:hypothetical protein